MSVIRPELKAAFWRWREPIFGACFAAGCLWLALNSFGIVRYLAYALMLVGAALTFVGIQRARFQQSGQGPGVVEVDERAIRYFGPFSGGAVAVDDLILVELIPDPVQGQSWRLSSGIDAPLVIPANARGAENMFDVFAAMQGVSIERLLHHLNTKTEEPVVIWRKPRPALH